MNPIATIPQFSFRCFTWLVVAAALFMLSAQAAPLVSTTFTGPHAEQSWSLAELNPDLPHDWTGYEFLVLEFKASSSQRFDLALETAAGRASKRIGPFAGVWVRAAISLRFYRAPAGNGIDLAATYNQPRGSYWINLGGDRFVPTTDVRAIGVSMEYPVASPTLEIRSVSLAKTDPGDAVLDGTPLVDEFGQYTHVEWPGKVHWIQSPNAESRRSDSLEELKKIWFEEQSMLANRPLAGEGRCQFGGFLNTSAKATGFFHVEEIDGRWWFVCPDGHLFFSAGVNGVTPYSGTPTEGREKLFAVLPPTNLLPPASTNPQPRMLNGSYYTWNLQRRFGNLWRGGWASLTQQRLTAWGFNSIHYWSPRSSGEQEPIVPYAQMLRGWQTEGSIMGMPDVYGADFEQRVDEAAARQLDPRHDDCWMLGYFIGNEPPWPGRESQLVDAILSGPSSEIQKRLRAYLAEGDTPERRTHFVYAAFERYLDVINAACRRHAPHHLNLGIRFGGDLHEDLVKLMRGRCDVFSLNIYRYAPDRVTLEQAYAITQRPLLIGEFHIGAPERGLAPGLVQAMNQSERGQAYRYYVEQCASHPALIGTHWFQWLDQPVTGRPDGENYNIGFVDVTDQPYAELVAAAKETHARLLAIHSGKIPPTDRLPKASEAGTPPPPIRNEPGK